MLFHSPKIKGSQVNSLRIRSKNQSPSPVRSSLSLSKRFLEGVVVPDKKVPFFHGKITREYAERILLSKGTIDGSFLLRESINWNYAISICYKGLVHHYNIERQDDGSYRIPTGHLFPGPIELVQYHSCNLDGFLTLAQIPVNREPGESPIIITGISTSELEDHIKLKAVEMGLTGSNIDDALNGPMRDHLQYLVLKDMHLYQSWFHDIIGRREAEKRLARAGLYDGDFLIRLRKEDGTYVLSIVYHNEPKHYKIEKEFEYLSIEGGQTFNTLVELVDHYHFRQDGLLYKLKRGVHNPDFTRTRSGSNSITHERSLSPRQQNLPSTARQMTKNILDIKCHEIPMSNGNFDTRNSTQSLPSLGGSYPLNSQNTSPTASSTSSSQGGGHQTINYKMHLCFDKEKNLSETTNLPYPKSPDQVSDLINLSDWPNISKLSMDTSRNPKPLEFLNEMENQLLNKAGQQQTTNKDGFQHTPFTPPTPMPNDFTTPTPQNCTKNPLDLVPLPPPPKNFGITPIKLPVNKQNELKSLPNNNNQQHQTNGIRASKPSLGPHTADLTATVDALVQMTFSGKKNLTAILPTDNSLHSTHILDTNWEEPESSESNFSMSSFLNQTSNPTNPFNQTNSDINNTSSNLSSVSSFLSTSCQNQQNSTTTSRQTSIASSFDQVIYDKIPITTFQLNRDQLTLKERLGGGNFGHVVRGVYQPAFGGEIPVAVKTLKESSMVLAEEREILAEAKTMSQLRHRNIVRLIGICRDHHFMLVLELARLGPINKYLRKHQNFPVSQVAELMSQVAQGMAYLESCKFVHRDLAARNVLLVSKDYAKISDFGMSKALNMGSDYYQSKNAGKWPLKWYAPECIYYYRFDSKSDVWSYGVTLWECFAYGEKPYKDMKGTEILGMLDEGGRLKRPERCPEAFYDIMLSCWQFDGTDRPSFSEIVPIIQKHCKNL